MLRSTLLAVSTDLRGPLSNRLLPHSYGFFCAPDFDTALTYFLNVCVPDDIPDLTVLECFPDCTDPASGLCQELVPRLNSQQFLVLVNDPPEAPSTLADLLSQYKFQVRVVTPTRLLSLDILNWLSPSGIDRLLQNGEFVFRPSTQEVIIMDGEEPWPTVKLNHSQAMVLEYLLLHATGMENRRSARQIFKGIWGNEHYSFDDRELRKTIQSLREQLEADPRQPELIISIQGRNGGYYIRAPEASAPAS